MDLLSLTFRSLGLTESEKKRDSFLNVGKQQTTYKTSTSYDREKPRRLKRTELKSISLDEVAWHDTPDDCWLVIYDYVYDCTELVKTHSGGQDVLLEYAGRDATLGFIDTGHSKTARETLERYLIGELPIEQRIFRVPGGVKVVGF